jgi:hypothetical protein
VQHVADDGADLGWCLLHDAQPISDLVRFVAWLRAQAVRLARFKLTDQLV